MAKKLEKLEKPKESSWGGKREGSGRRPLLNQEDLERVKELVAQHASEVDESDLEKRERALVLMGVLFEEGKQGNIPAIKEYFDRQMGKAKERVEHSGGLKLERVSQEEFETVLQSYASRRKEDSNTEESV